MTKRALLIGVPGGGVNVSLAARRLEPVLERLGFASITTCSGPKATRDGILRAFDRLERACEAGDAVLIHYFGHGGRARFTDLLSEQVFGYVTTTQATRGAGFEAILDIELSSRMSALERRCGNLTVMLDCCYSGELVRSGGSRSSRGRGRELETEHEPDATLSTTREQSAPDWAREVLESSGGRELALDSHPGIVRLCGASPKREAFAAVRSGRHIGRLTEAFIAALDEVGEDWGQLYWESFGHRLREHVVEALAMEGQWVALAGPVERRLFSTQVVDAPGCVSFVPSDEPGRGWLRAGWHQGLSVGDRWAVLDPRAPDGQAGIDARRLVELEVTKVGRNRADVCFEAERAPELRSGFPAAPLALAERVPLRLIDATPELREALERSAWLTLDSNPQSALQLVREGEAHVLHTADGAARHLASARPRALVERVEDLARVEALARCHAARTPSNCPLQWRWSLATSCDAPLPETGAQLHVGDRICVELSLDPDALPWFVSVVLVEADGRLRLLNTRMPEGLELAPGDRERIGWRVGRAGPQGLELSWPAQLEADAPAPTTLLILASRRPIELGHIVRPQLRDRDAAFAVQGLADETLRGRKPEHSRGCAWAQIEFTLAPATRA